MFVIILPNIEWLSFFSLLNLFTWIWLRDCDICRTLLFGSYLLLSEYCNWL